MAAPVVKGLLITASVLVAAGVAFYENEQIREWILTSRRKLAVALQSLADEIQPPSHTRSNFESEEDDAATAESRRRRREEIIRLNRLELVKRAREEGIAVDLDQLAAIGREVERDIVEEGEGSVRLEDARSPSFDHIVGHDGMLRSIEMGEASGVSSDTNNLRHRSAGARGLDTGANWANPFTDEMQVLYDQDEPATRESSKTLSPKPLVDLSEDGQSEYFSEEELEAQIEEAIRRSIDDVSQTPQASDPLTSIAADEDSFYYAPPPNINQPPMSTNSLYTSAIQSMLDEPMQNSLYDDDGHETPSGTLTPTEDGFSTIASMASGGDDIGSIADLHSVADNEENHDDAMSENGYATSEFSMVGASTPGSWSDVDSEASEEAGHQSHHANAPNVGVYPTSNAGPA
ncbi:hypothetical protein EJ08DRAFT_645749 [Tothia fuscella]|uniref:Uncharacterized protein n=1 Tax=Tothia fuscella TaxID=1048955 RepID=A0A9P4U268_9PEZI|nr:hypothetical protein EJ08DRAFT_645749 [Tothia fuscella]